MSVTRKDRADAHLVAIWSNLNQLRKFESDIDLEFLQAIADDIATLQTECQNMVASEAVC